MSKTVEDLNGYYMGGTRFADPKDKDAYYEIDTEWMADNGIHRDGDSNMYVDDSGRQYTWNELHLAHYRKNSDGAYERDDKGGGNTAGSLGGYGQQYTQQGNNVLNTNQVTANPIMYWPTNNNRPASGSGSDKSNGGSIFALSSKLGINSGSGGIADASHVLGSKAIVIGSKSEITSKRGVLNYKGGVPHDDILSQNGLMSAPDIKQINLSVNKSSCNYKSSYFYLLDKDGNNPDKYTYELFGYLNDRAGGIFELCADGKVLLMDGKDPQKVITSDSVSRILALTVNNAIAGGIGNGEGENNAPYRHTLRARVFKPGDLEANNIIFFDSYEYAVIDLDDYRNILNSYPAEQQNPDEEILNNCIIQAAYFGHFIYEWSSTVNFSYNNSLRYFHSHHRPAIDRECEIICEMVKLPAGTLNYLVEDKTIHGLKGAEFAPYHFRYPFKSGIGAIIITNFIVVKKSHPYKSVVLFGEIVINKKYDNEKADRENK